MIADEIKVARTEYVVYFLLMAYVEARVHARQFNVPADVKRFPIWEEADVNGRLRTLRQVLGSQTNDCDVRAVKEAIDVFAAATERLAAMPTRLPQVSAHANRGTATGATPEVLKTPFKRSPPADLRLRARAYGHFAGARKNFSGEP